MQVQAMKDSEQMTYIERNGNNFENWFLSFKSPTLKLKIEWKIMPFDDLRSVRCTGAEYVAFFSDEETWPEGRYLTQMVNRINGDWMPDNLQLSEIAADAVIEISDQGDVFEVDSNFQVTNILIFFTEWQNKRRLVLQSELLASTERNNSVKTIQERKI